MSRVLIDVLVAVAFFGLLMGYYVFRTSQKTYESEERFKKNLGQTMLRSLTRGMYFDILKRSEESIGKKTEDAAGDPSVFYIMVYDKEFNVIFKQFRGGLDLALLPPPYADPIDDDILIRQIRSTAGEHFLDLQMEVKLHGGKPGTGIGHARLGITLEDAIRELWRARIEGIALVVVVLFLGGLMSWVIMREILPPINKLAQASRQIGKGDLSVQVEVHAEDEIGMLAMTFNEMVSSIRQQTRRLESMLDNISSAVQILSYTTNTLLEIAGQQSSGSSMQTTIVVELVSTIEEISSTANKIADAADRVGAVSKRSSEAVYEGKRLIDLTFDHMDQIKTKTRRSTDHAMELSEQAELIGGVIDIIKEIGEQASLLSLNAQIEAAAAGESGRRFMVVASEVRTLSNRVLDATNSVKELVDTVRQSIESMTVLAKEEQSAVDEGVKSVVSVGEYFQLILESVDMTRDSAAQITSMTREQSSVTDQIVGAMQDVKGLAQQVEMGVKDIENSMHRLNKIAGDLTELLEKEKREGF